MYLVSNVIYYVLFYYCYCVCIDPEIFSFRPLIIPSVLYFVSVYAIQ